MSRLSILLLGAALVVPVSAWASASPTGSTFSIIPGPDVKRRPDVAFDTANQVYLTVTSNSDLRGAFVSADGVPVGGVFGIDQGGATQQAARVAYSPDAGAFLVTWLDYRNGDLSQVYGRMVKYVSGVGATFLTNEFLIDTGLFDAHSEMGAAVAYSTADKEFLVVWRQTRFDGAVFDVFGQRVSAGGALLGSEIRITNDSAWQAEPDVAYNPARNEFYVIFGYSPASGGDWAAGRRVKSGTGALLDAPMNTVVGGGVFVTVPQVEYDPSTGGYMTAWYQNTGGAMFYGQRLNGDGTPSGSVFPLVAGYGSYDGFALQRNQVSSTYLAAFHDSSPEDVGIEMSPSGSPGSVFQITGSGGTGNFNPRLAAHHSRPQWLLVTARSLNQIVGQRVSSTATGGGVTTTQPPPPPPPAVPEVPMPDPPNSNFAAGGNMNVLWQHTDGYLSSWQLSGPALASATALSPARVNDPKWRIVATGDFNLDGRRDITFQHDDGWVAVWLMNGAAMVEARLLTPNKVNDPDWRIVGSGDFNRDGTTDLIFRHRTNGWLAGWLMNGTVMQSATLLSPQRVADTAWKIVAVGDMNRDTLPDLVWQHDTTGIVTSWLMNGFTMAAGQEFNPSRLADPQWKVKGIGDVNGDGKPDLIWQHGTQNWLAGTILNGTTVVDSIFLSPGQVNSGWSIVGPK